MIVACAVDDGKNFVDRHFGDAEYYFIYMITKDSKELIRKIKNTTEEEIHAEKRQPFNFRRIWSLIFTYWEGIIMFMGRGQGGHGSKRRSGRGEGPGGSCVCPRCGTEVAHQRGIPCFEMTCPKCGQKMARKGSGYNNTSSARE